MDKLKDVEQLVIAHVSERHGGYRDVLQLLVAALPPSIMNKVCFVVLSASIVEKEKKLLSFLC